MCSAVYAGGTYILFGITWRLSCVVAGEGDWKESTAMAESEVSETLVQVGLLHTKELQIGRASCRERV